MAIDSGPCLSDLPGIPLLRAIETVWLEGPALYVFVMFGIMMFCATEEAIGAAVLCFYALLYFVVFATRRSLTKALLVTLIVMSAAQALHEAPSTRWFPSFTHTEVPK